MGRIRRSRSRTWSDNDDDDQLVGRCLRGNPEAFSILYDRYLPNLYAYAYRMLGDQIDAEEAAHDALTRAWSKLRLYQNNNFRSWLFNIAHNTIRDRQRIGRRAGPALEPALGLAAPGSTADEAINLVTVNDIAKLLSQFPENQQAAVAMKLSGLKYAEIAVALGKSEAAVAQDYSRVIRRLAQAMEPDTAFIGPVKGGGHDV